MDYTLKKIIKEVAKELSIDPNVVSTVVSSQFKFVTLKMKENIATREDPIISLNFLGKFLVKKNRRAVIKISNEKKLDEIMSFIKERDVNIK